MPAAELALHAILVITYPAEVACWRALMQTGAPAPAETLIPHALCRALELDIMAALLTAMAVIVPALLAT